MCSLVARWGSRLRSQDMSLDLTQHCVDFEGTPLCTSSTSSAFHSTSMVLVSGLVHFVDLFSWAVQIDGLGPKNLKGTLGCKVQLDIIELGLEMTRVYVPGHKMI